VPHEIVVSSAHRNPARTRALARGAIRRGVEVFIVGAGISAHLPGAIAAETTLPIIGVPLASSHLAGQDALLSIVQMPTGVPVATMAIGVAGARNAAILAVQILALGNPTVRAALRRYKTGLAR
jgi:phosphoribosylaminoimidazole carboxylase PurE protein